MQRHGDTLLSERALGMQRLAFSKRGEDTKINASPEPIALTRDSRLVRKRTTTAQRPKSTRELPPANVTLAHATQQSAFLMNNVRLLF